LLESGGNISTTGSGIGNRRNQSNTTERITNHGFVGWGRLCLSGKSGTHKTHLKFGFCDETIAKC
jgi:hypothetical protein